MIDCYMYSCKIVNVRLGVAVAAVNYLSYGAFCSYAPVYDSATANISKDDSDLLLSTYCDESGIQYAARL